MTFGDFVVSCRSIAVREHARLIRMGVLVPCEDAYQDSFVALLEAQARFTDEIRSPRALARVIIRGRLIRDYVERPLREKRKATAHLRLDALEHEGPSHPSREGEIVDALTFKQITAREPLPVGRRHTRQAEHQAMQRWVKRARRAA